MRSEGNHRIMRAVTAVIVTTSFAASAFADDKKNGSRPAPAKSAPAPVKSAPPAASKPATPPPSRQTPPPAASRPTRPAPSKPVNSNPAPRPDRAQPAPGPVAKPSTPAPQPQRPDRATPPASKPVNNSDDRTQRDLNRGNNNNNNSRPMPTTPIPTKPVQSTPQPDRTPPVASKPADDNTRRDLNRGDNRGGNQHGNNGGYQGNNQGKPNQGGGFDRNNGGNRGDNRGDNRGGNQHGNNGGGYQGNNNHGGNNHSGNNNNHGGFDRRNDRPRVGHHNPRDSWTESCVQNSRTQLDRYLDNRDHRDRFDRERENFRRDRCGNIDIRQNIYINYSTVYRTHYHNYRRYGFHGGYYFEFRPLVDVTIYLPIPLYKYFYMRVDRSCYDSYYGPSYAYYPVDDFRYAGVFFPTVEFKDVILAVSTMDYGKQYRFRQQMTSLAEQLDQRMRLLSGYGIDANDVVITDRQVLSDRGIVVEGYVDHGLTRFGFKSFIDLNDTGRFMVFVPGSPDLEPSQYEIDMLFRLNSRIFELNGRVSYDLD